MTEIASLSIDSLSDAVFGTEELAVLVVVVVTFGSLSSAFNRSCNSIRSVLSCCTNPWRYFICSFISLNAVNDSILCNRIRHVVRYRSATLGSPNPCSTNISNASYNDGGVPFRSTSEKLGIVSS